jgi:hypothetical protein
MGWGNSPGGLSNAGGTGGGGVGHGLQRGPQKGAGGAWVGRNNGGGNQSWNWGILGQLPGMLNTLVKQVSDSASNITSGGTAAPTKPPADGPVRLETKQNLATGSLDARLAALNRYAGAVEPGLERQNLWTAATGMRPGMNPGLSMLSDAALGMLGISGVGGNMAKALVGTAYDRGQMLKGMEEFAQKEMGLSPVDAAALVNTWNVRDLGNAKNFDGGNGDGNQNDKTDQRRYTAAVAAEADNSGAQSTTETGSDEMKPETVGEEYAVQAKEDRRKRFSFLDTLYNEGWGATGAATLYNPRAGGA